MEQCLRFPAAIRRDPVIDTWLDAQVPELGAIARKWFARMRRCGPDVRELMHDGCPTACVGEAAFGYVAVFRAHANVGFFFGAALDDPMRLLEGTGKRMRHVKMRPARVVADGALEGLITAAYADIRLRLART